MANAFLNSPQVPAEHNQRAAFYAAKAEECRRLSETSDDSDMRDHWLQLANQWAYLQMHASQTQYDFPAEASDLAPDRDN